MQQLGLAPRHPAMYAAAPAASPGCKPPEPPTATPQCHGSPDGFLRGRVNGAARTRSAVSPDKLTRSRYGGAHSLTRRDAKASEARGCRCFEDECVRCDPWK